MPDPYDYWKAALAGEKPPMYVDDPKPGFYRTAIREQLPLKNGQGLGWKRTGWKPVAIFHHNDGTLMAVVGHGDERVVLLVRDDINDIWTYCAGNPVSEKEYRGVAELGEGWADECFKGETK